HLAMRRYPPERPAAAAGSAPAASDDTPAGATLIVRELASGRDTTFGNVSEYAWQDKGGLLALAISAEDKAGNGVQLFDSKSSAPRVLDSAAPVSGGLVWRKESDDLAALRGKTDDRHDGPTQIALAWTGLAGGTPGHKTFDPTAGSALAPNLRTVSFRRP